MAVSEAVLVFLLALLTAVATGFGALPFLFCPHSPECVEKLSEKPHERANLLAIRRLIAV